VDIVFSTAAARLTPDTAWAERVEEFIDTNNLGTTRILRAFPPLLRPGGRLIVVASDFGAVLPWGCAGASILTAGRWTTWMPTRSPGGTRRSRPSGLPDALL
jgi:NAD(P)-dependent dehydrogenase (short-subunit alcohol dehydrogenase family)